MAYDTAYAMVDREDDLKVGVKSTAILFGNQDRRLIAVFHALTLVLLGIAGGLAGRGILYYTGLGLAAALAVYQQYLLRGRTPAGCFKAFLNNNWFGAAVFAGLLLDYLKSGN